MQLHERVRVGVDDPVEIVDDAWHLLDARINVVREPHEFGLIVSEDLDFDGCRRVREIVEEVL